MGFSMKSWFNLLLNLMFDYFLYSLVSSWILFNATLYIGLLYVHVCKPFVLLYNICVKFFFFFFDVKNICVKLKTVVITTCIYTGYVSVESQYVLLWNCGLILLFWMFLFIYLLNWMFSLFNHNSMGLFCILDRNGQRGTDDAVPSTWQNNFGFTLTKV